MNSKKKFFLFVVFLILSVIMASFSGYSGLNFFGVINFFSTNHIFSVFAYNLFFIISASFSFSVSILTSSGAFLFSWYEVLIYAMIGIVASSIIDFYISRKLGRNYIRNYIRKRGGKIEKFDEVLGKDSFKSILILSTIFFVPPTIPNFLGGIMSIDLKKYFVATFLGNLPNTFFTILLINGFIYSNLLLISLSTVGLILTTLTAIYFYNGEIKELFLLSLPRIFFKK